MLTTEQIWQLSSAELRAYINRRVAQPQDAEDILQESFIKIHARLDTLEDEDSLAPWLYRLTQNTIMQRGRALLQQQISECCALEFDRQGGIIDYRVLALSETTCQEIGC